MKCNNTAMTKYENSFNSNNKSTGKYISKINIENGNFEYSYETIEFPGQLNEHYNCAMKVSQCINNMKIPVIISN